MRFGSWLNMDEEILVGISGICSVGMNFIPGLLVSAALAVPTAKKKVSHSKKTHFPH